MAGNIMKCVQRGFDKFLFYVLVVISLGLFYSLVYKGKSEEVHQSLAVYDCPNDNEANKCGSSCTKRDFMLVSFRLDYITNALSVNRIIPEGPRNRISLLKHCAIIDHNNWSCSDRDLGYVPGPTDQEIDQLEVFSKFNGNLRHQIKLFNRSGKTLSDVFSCMKEP